MLRKPNFSPRSAHKHSHRHLFGPLGGHFDFIMKEKRQREVDIVLLTDSSSIKKHKKFIAYYRKRRNR